MGLAVMPYLAGASRPVPIVKVDRVTSQVKGSTLIAKRALEQAQGTAVRPPHRGPVRLSEPDTSGESLIDTFTRLVTEASGWAYGIILLFALIDSVLPVVPSEATVITAGVVSSAGHLDLALVLVAAGAGAWLGDNLAYFLGRVYGERVKARFFSGAKAERRVAWAERQLQERGSELVIVGRFIPAGRTVVTLSAGTLAFPWRRFATFDAAGAIIWALYAGLLGYFGGKAFEDEPWKGLLLAFGLALAVTGLIELVRWLRRR